MMLNFIIDSGHSTLPGAHQTRDKVDAMVRFNGKKIVGYSLKDFDFD